MSPTRAATPTKDLPEVHSGGWIVSSFDLLKGADVADDPDTVPDELFDELFPPKPDIDNADTDKKK